MKRLFAVVLMLSFVASACADIAVAISNSFSYSEGSGSAYIYGYGVQVPIYRWCRGCYHHYDDYPIEPVSVPESPVPESVSGGCEVRYATDIVFEAKKKRLEGVGANELFAFLRSIQAASLRGCATPKELVVTAFACLGCDKSRKQADSVVEGLAVERARVIEGAIHFIVDSRGLSAMDGVKITTTTKVVDFPSLGVIPKSAMIEGFVEDDADTKTDVSSTP